MRAVISFSMTRLANTTFSHETRRPLIVASDAEGTVRPVRRDSLVSQQVSNHASPRPDLGADCPAAALLKADINDRHDGHGPSRGGEIVASCSSRRAVGRILYQEVAR